jgi:hypothetical protein
VRRIGVETGAQRLVMGVEANLEEERQREQGSHGEREL